MRIQKSREVKEQVQGHTARQRTMSQLLTIMCSLEQAPTPHLFIMVAVVAFSEPTCRVGRISSGCPRWGMHSRQWGVWFRLLLLVLCLRHTAQSWPGLESPTWQTKDTHPGLCTQWASWPLQIELGAPLERGRQSGTQDSLLYPQPLTGHSAGRCTITIYQMKGTDGLVVTGGCPDWLPLKGL